MSQDAQKFGENPLMHTGDIAQTKPQNGIFCTFAYIVTLTFDLLNNLQPNQFISDPRCTNDKFENSSMHTTDITETTSRTDAQTDAQTT